MSLNSIKTAIFFIMAGVLITGCGKKQEPAKIIRPVKYITVGQSEPQEIKTFSGLVQADIDTTLSFKVKGNIKNLYVKEGDSVTKGQLIATLDKEPYVIQYEDAVASFQKATSGALNAQKYYARMSKLYIDGAISDRQLDDAKANLDATKNTLTSVEKKKEFAKLQLEYTKLYSPLDGFVSSVSREINENVAAGMPVLGMISGQSPEVKINIPESYINFFKKKDIVKITIEALDNKSFKGEIKEVAIDSLGTSTYPVIISILNPSKGIRSGMSADVELSLNKNTKSTIVVPLNAVKEDAKGRHVLLVEETQEGLGQVKRVDVEIGSIQKGGLEIKSGLNFGDKLITAGVSKLKDGDLVRVGGDIL